MLSTSDMMEKIIMYICVIGLCAVMIIITFAIYDEVKSDKISLRLDHWQCVEYRSRPRLIGKVIIPYNECHEWRRK